MCDEGRYNYKWLDIDRIQTPMTLEPSGLKPVAWNTVLETWRNGSRRRSNSTDQARSRSFPSPQITNEELFLVRKLFFEHLKIPVLPLPHSVGPDAVEDNFLMKKDKNPNSKGAELILSEQKGLPVKDPGYGKKKECIRLLYVFHADLLAHFDPGGAKEALNRVETVI